MKKLYLLLLLFVVNIFPQTENTEENIKSFVNSYISLCKEGDAKKTTGIILYKGDDQKRNLSTFLNPANADELKRAERYMKKIVSLLKLSDNFTTTIENRSRPNNIEQFDVAVNFNSKGNSIKINIIVQQIGNSLGILEVN